MPKPQHEFLALRREYCLLLINIKSNLECPKFYGSIKKETVCSQNFVDPQKFETSGYGALLFHKIQNVNISSKVTELLRFNPSITDNFNHKTTQSGRKNLIKSHVSVFRKKRAVHRAQRTETP